MSRGTHIGAYRILRLINQGGQGTVYLGIDERLHRRVAIKIYRLPRDKTSRRAVLREAQLVASIQSPKVVQIYDLVAASDHVALIMEYAPGCDLEELLEHVVLSLSSILTICADIAAALAVVRQQHIVHGDLKAGNILITRQGRVKLTDFGIARGQVSADRLPDTAASVSSISPEQYLGQPLDIRSDLFSLGCLLYRMLTGRHPFVTSGELKVESLLYQTPPPVESLVPESICLPPELSELLSTLLQKDPENRPGNTHEVRNTLRKIAREVPLSVGNTLLQEAEPFFRIESPEDIPPAIPGDLTRKGRSELRKSGLFPDFIAQNPLRSAGVLFLCVFAVGFLLRGFLSNELRVVIESPHFIIATQAELPAELSPRWVSGEIETALYSHLDSPVVVGKEPQKTFFSRDLLPGHAKKSAMAELRVLPELHCVEEICLLDLVLEKAGERFSEQKLVFSNTPISQWRNTVRRATVALLDQSR